MNPNFWNFFVKAFDVLYNAKKYLDSPFWNFQAHHTTKISHIDLYIDMLI